MARQRESFFEGLMRGYQMHQNMVRQERLDREASEDRVLRNKTLGIQQEMLGIQRNNAESEAARRKQEQEAEDAIRKAGKIGIETQFLPGKTEGELDQVFNVNGQQFKNRAAAEAAAEGLNSPLAIAKRQYQAAQESGVGSLIERYGNVYKNARATVEDEFRQDLTSAMRDGGVTGVLDFYNKRVKDGRTMVAQRGPNGQLMVGTYVGGKLQGEPTVYANEQEFIAEQKARYMASPDAYLDYYQRGRQFGEGQRQFDATMGLNRDKLKQDGEYQQGQLAIGRTNAAANMMQASTGQQVANRPQFQFTDSPDGKNTTGVGVRWNPTKNQPEVSEPFTVPGIRRQPAAVSPIDAAIAERMRNRGGVGQMGTGTVGIEIDESGLARLDQMMNGQGR